VDQDKDYSTLAFSGAPGVGKTTLAKILIKQLDIDEYDILEINASRENSVDTIREKITNFVATMPFGTFKVVLLDEADYISPNGQAALRGVMETYHASARFILTCNYPIA
jgi:DNA polymerase III delta prime subunit